jgi:hypothetical protein
MIIEGNFFLAYQNSKYDMTLKENGKNKEPQSRPPNEERSVPDNNKKHNKRQEQDTFTQQEQLMDNGENRRRSSDTMQLEAIT